MNPIVMYICNAVIAVAGIGAVALGKVTWSEFLMLAPAILTNVAAVGGMHAKTVIAARRMARAAAQRAQKAPRAPSTLLPPTMLLMLALAFGACSPSAPPSPSAPVHGGISFGGGGGGSAPPTGTGFITVTGGAQDGTALAFPLSEAKGGTGAASFPGVKPIALTFSPANFGKGRAFTWLNADYTVGIKFVPTTTGVQAKGVRFWYDTGDHAARAVKVALVNITGSSLIEAVTSTSLAAGAIYEVDFASAHTLTAFNTYAVTARATTGIYAAFDSGSGAGPAVVNASFGAPMFMWRADGSVYLPINPLAYTSGDNPASVGGNVDAIAARVVPLEPVFQ